jgi:4-methyl-5(b-hydroxyethyl)-thiazole monophosphate biosynthesis
MVYVFLADGFEEIEALTPIDILRRGGVDVKTVGVTGMTVTGSHKIAVSADIALSDIDIDTALMIVFPGGQHGTDNLKADPKIAAMLQTAAAKGIYIAAICAAPSILGEAGLLEGKEAICFPGFEKALKGANISQHSVVQDGQFITAKGAGVAAKFGFKLLSLLTDTDTAARIRSVMQYE